MKRTLAMTCLAMTCLAMTLVSAGCTAAHSHAPSHRIAATHSQAPTTGTVSGRFLREGGPIEANGQQPDAVPLPGIIVFTRGGHRVIAVRVGRSGRFSVRLPAGRYQAQGSSPLLLAQGARHLTPCSGRMPVTVALGRTTMLTVTCFVP